MEMYITHIGGGNEVCAMWKDVKGKMMEQCFYAGEKMN